MKPIILLRVVSGFGSFRTTEARVVKSVAMRDVRAVSTKLTLGAAPAIATQTYTPTVSPLRLDQRADVIELRTALLSRMIKTAESAAYL